MPDQRVLILAPTGADAQVASDVLAEAAIPSAACATVADLCEMLERPNAGALLVAEEALITDECWALVNCLDRQPAWSDVPLIVLTMADESGQSSRELAERFGAVANMTLLERPFRRATLVSTLQAALRARRRQYEVRKLLASERAAEEALAQTQARLDLAVSAAEIGTFYCPMPLGAIVWNDTCKEHFWLPADVDVDMDLFYARLHPDDRGPTREAIERSIFRRESYDINYRTVAPDGRLRWIRAKGRAYYDAAGSPTRFDGITVDITPQKEAEHEREQLLASERAARAEAERASQMKDEFLATLSHELRTPLNAIVGWSQILNTSREEEDLKEGLDVIARNARAQQQIIEDLLDMSRIISGKVRLDVQRIDLRDVVQAAVDTTRHAADAKGIRLQCVLDPKAGPVSGDPNRLQQVFWNFLTNSIKFTPRGGRVQVLLERVNSHLEVAVIDTGEGINPDFLPHVFDRFRQADASTTRQHGGLGLGLAIVKQFVELHGGTIRVKSPGTGQGSTFTVALPVTIIHPAHHPEPERRHPRAPAESNAPAQSCLQLRGVNVLVVDDEPDARGLVKRLLEDCDARVQMAASVAEAMALLAAGKFDVVVSDIGMPSEDGYSLIRRVRALPADKGGQTPAVALTAYARSEDRTKAIRAGYQMHVSKPVEPTELIAMVASLAGRTG